MMLFLIFSLVCYSPTNTQLNLSPQQLHNLGLLAIQDYPKGTFCKEGRKA